MKIIYKPVSEFRPGDRVWLPEWEQDAVLTGMSAPDENGMQFCTLAARDGTTKIGVMAEFVPYDGNEDLLRKRQAPPIEGG